MATIKIDYLLSGNTKSQTQVNDEFAAIMARSFAEELVTA